jgi:uncharacterized protein YggE
MIRTARKRLFLCAFSLAALAGAPLSARAETPAETPAVISVTGEAHISAPPDLAEINAGVTSDGKTAREASDANSAAMSKVLLALKSAGIDAKDYQTSRLSLQAQYSVAKQGSAATVIGYRAGNQVNIRLRDVTRLASVLDILVGAGANEISGIQFMVSQASKLLDDAREQAIADARRKAEIYAKAAGVTLGAPVSISEEGAAQPVFYDMPVVAKAAGAPMQIAQGEQTLSITVRASWAIKAAP